MVNINQSYDYSKTTSRLQTTVSLFRNVKKTERKEEIRLADLLKLIKEGNEELKGLSYELRELKLSDPLKYKARKKAECPYFVIGDFPYANQNHCKTYFPLHGFDVDGLDKVPDLSTAFDRLKDDPYVFASFLSPSGQGLRILIWSDNDKDHHRQAREPIYRHLSELLELPLRSSQDERKGPHIDKNVDKLAQMWFYTWQPEEALFHVNLKSKVFPFEPPAKEPTKQEEGNEGNRGGEASYKYEFTTDEKVQDVIRTIEEKRQDITQGVETWFTKALLPLAGEYGENGRELAHRISCFHPAYSEQETDQDFTRALAKANGSVGIGSFLAYAKDNGITYDVKRMLQERGEPSSPSQAPVKEPAHPEDLDQEPEDFTGHSTIKNLEDALKDIAEYRFNVITGMPEIKPKKAKEWEQINDRMLNTIVRRLKYKSIKGASKSTVADLIESNFSPEANPIEEYFSSLENINATGKIDELAQTITLDPDDPDHHTMFTKYLTKWLVGSIANAYDKKTCRNHFCFVLTGPQGTFKSTWIKALCPPELQLYYKEGGVDPENKDSILDTTTNFIFNLDDYFASVTGKKINEFKGFITKNTVKVRMPYGRYPEERPKICSFIGSSNEQEFLHDSTGNRRFLPFQVQSIDLEAAKTIDINKVWAEAYQKWKSGYEYWLTPNDKDELAKHNEQFEVQHKEYELLIQYFRKPVFDKEAREYEAGMWMTNTQILQYLDTMSGLRPSKKKVGEALSKAKFERSQKRINGRRSWCYNVVKVDVNDNKEPEEIEEKATEGDDLPF